MVGRVRILMVVICLAVFSGNVFADDAELQRLAAENKLLRAQVRALRQQLDAALADNRNLRKAAGAAAPTTQSPSTTTKPTGHTYLGKARTQAWFDNMYKEFSGKISVLDGKYHDIGADLLERRSVTRTPPDIGTLRWPGYKGRIVQAIGNGEALVEGLVWGTGESLTYHVKGIPEAQNINEAKFEKPLIYVGTHSYTSALGTRQTVQGYVVHRSLTKDQFAQALASGFKLVRYKYQKKTVREGNKRVAKKVLVAKPVR